MALPAAIRSRFRANPILHAGNWLGVDTGNVVWNNYETRHYYFPVQFRPEIDRPHPDELEHVITHDDAARTPPTVLGSGNESSPAMPIRSTNCSSIRSDPRLDAVTERWFHLATRGARSGSSSETEIATDRHGFWGMQLGTNPTGNLGSV